MARELTRHDDVTHNRTPSHPTRPSAGLGFDRAGAGRPSRPGPQAQSSSPTQSMRNHNRPVFTDAAGLAGLSQRSDEPEVQAQIREGIVQGLIRVRPCQDDPTRVFVDAVHPPEPRRHP